MGETPAERAARLERERLAREAGKARVKRDRSRATDEQLRKAAEILRRRSS